MRQLSGQVVIVTGASAGIGAETARVLAAAGAHVVLAARRGERLEVLRAEIEGAARGSGSGAATAVACDLTRADDRERLVQAALAINGRIAALVNNAGFGQRGPVELVPVEKIRENFELNLFSLIDLTQLIIPHLRAQGDGRIVNVSSVAGRIARPLSSIYDATKHALEAISDGLRGELAPFGIKVVVVEPGFILTEFRAVADEVSRDVAAHAGPYAPFYAANAHNDKRTRRVAGQPADIAALILTALTASRPRSRYAGPAHAHVLLALKRLLPETWFDRLLARQSGVKVEHR